MEGEKLKLYWVRDSRIALTLRTVTAPSCERRMSGIFLPTLSVNFNNTGYLEREYSTLLQNRMSREGLLESRLTISMKHEEMASNQDVSDCRKEAKIEVSGCILRQLGAGIAENRMHWEYTIRVEVTIFPERKPEYSSESLSKDECSGISFKTKTEVILRQKTLVCTATATAHGSHVWDTWSNMKKGIHWANLTIVATFDRADVTLLLKNVSEERCVLEKILKEELASDVTIVAENGVKIKCHWSFLMAHSPVFKAMFESNMEEVATGSVKMTEMTEANVRAFLAYLYYSETSSAQNELDVAVALLRAGHMYMIGELVQNMKKIILDSNLAWLSVDIGIEIFLVARNLLHGETKLINWAMQILRAKPAELMESPCYQQLFLESPQVAMDLCKCALSFVPENN